MKVLVAYSSKRGSTAEIAEAVAEALRGAGVEADCEGADHVQSLDGYNAVILGSAVYMKHWRGEARHFLRKQRKRLAELPFWVFSSGPVGDPAQDQSGWLEPPKIIETAEKLGVRDHVVFGGRLPADPHGPIEKAMVSSTPAEYHDRRDWDEIREWALGIASSLRDEASAAAKRAA